MNNSFTYRAAVISDALRLSVLFQQTYMHTYGTEGVTTEYANFITSRFSIAHIEHTITSYPGNIIVAEYHDNLVGVVEVSFDHECPKRNVLMPEINKLYVLDHFCDKGIGHELLHEAEKFILSKGHHDIWLWVYLLNPRAIAFYVREGYRSIGNMMFQMEVNAYENVVMTKSLS
ncbi:MAG: GNAT family N-acetyltransferase [Bacteroidota bacterium]